MGTSKSSPSTNGAHWLASVMTAYDELVRQWSALSTMIQSSPPAGWRVSLEYSNDGPKLWAYRAPPSSPRIGAGTGTSSDMATYVSYIVDSSSTATAANDLAQFAGVAPLRSVAQTRRASTKAPSTSSKRATCRSVPRHSGR